MSFRKKTTLDGNTFNTTSTHSCSYLFCKTLVFSGVFCCGTCSTRTLRPERLFPEKAKRSPNCGSWGGRSAYIYIYIYYIYKYIYIYIYICYYCFLFIIIVIISIIIIITIIIFVFIVVIIFFIVIIPLYIITPCKLSTSLFLLDWKGTLCSSPPGHARVSTEH